jgi:3-hydroxyacyl-[acyl-carrier-protein] dehydratase
MTDIKQLLPHREPFLFVDSLETVTKEEIIGYRQYKDSEYFFKGHFPDYPVVPGVILCETMAQVGGAGVRELGVLPGDALFFFATIDKVKFRRQVRPNDTVKFVIKNLRIGPKMIKQSGMGFVGDEPCVEAEWMCLVGPAPKE